MAKYKLTLVSYYEDNDVAGDAAYNQQYVQLVADEVARNWNRVEAELQVNGSEVFKAVSDGGPTDHLERKSRWPWICAAEMLPQAACDSLVVFISGDWEEASFYPETSDHPAHFHISDNVFGRDVYERDFDRLYWRTIDLPEIKED